MPRAQTHISERDTHSPKPSANGPVKRIPARRTPGETKPSVKLCSVATAVKLSVQMRT